MTLVGYGPRHQNLAVDVSVRTKVACCLCYDQWIELSFPHYLPLILYGAGSEKMKLFCDRRNKRC